MERNKLDIVSSVDLNVLEIMQPFNYNNAIQEIDKFLENGEKKKAVEVFMGS